MKRFLAGVFLWLWSACAVAQQGPLSTPYSAIVPNNTTGVLVVAGAHAITNISLGTIASAPGYLKLYDTAVAPTCGSGTPVTRLIIPVAATAANGFAYITDGTAIPPRFFNGIGYCFTTGITDADTTAPSANQFLVNINWE